MQRIDIKGMTLSRLEDFILQLGEQKYRAKQLFDWLYTREAASFELMTTFSKALRDKLAVSAEIGGLKLSARQESHAEGTLKFLFELKDGKKIESVLIPPRTAFLQPDASDGEQQRLTLCVSTQAGCALDCAFCATASMGFLRNLTAGEIVDQVIQAKAISGRKITNVVYMGMGEPLMNYDNVMDSVEIVSTGLKITARRITISTAGWVPKIRQMADEGRKVKLAVSLHSLDDTVRTKLMPVTAKFGVNELLEALGYYYRRVKQRVTFEYILFDGLNDTDEDVRRLIKLSRAIPSKINIIPFHSIHFIHPSGIAAALHPAPRQRTEEFVEALRQANVSVFIRSSAGEDIDAACGQLAVKGGRGKSLRDRKTRNPAGHVLERRTG